MRILMYYDGTEYAKDALPLVKMHAKAFQAAVDIVCSLHKGGEPQLDEIDKMETDLAYLKGVLEKEKIVAETHLLIKGNDAGDDVIRFAKEHHVDEIVIGTEKKSRVEKFLLGSVAQHVIINAHCPVVIV
ncbi:MAG: universal stress protein [Desulfomonilia bacterium]|jgi:nucleotide-binding universal stress UspA family protein